MFTKSEQVLNSEHSLVGIGSNTMVILVWVDAQV